MPAESMSIVPETTQATAEVPIATRGNVVRDMIRGEGTYATTLLVWTLDSLGPECLTWHPTTLKEEVEKRAGTKVTKANFDKLMAAVTIVTTDVFYKDVARFIQLANVLAGDDFEPGEFDPADAVECAWAITEALLIWPPDDEDPEPFSDDVRHYLAYVLKEEGFVSAPDILRIAIGHDLRPNLNADFADDPEMYSALYEKQQDKADEVESMIRLSLTELFEQLTALPLERGSTEGLKKRMATLFPRR